MMKIEKRERVINIAAELCRVIIALVFIFSGFVKVVDPWGTALKIEEYLNAFGFGWLTSWKFFLSIWICGAELMMGLMLILKVRIRLISIFAAVLMSFFTLLTLVIAIWDPVDDCGCFGDVVMLSNWGTFFKNLILLPMTYFLMWSARKLSMRFTLSDLWYVLGIGLISFGIGLYSYMYLPMIDFLPYKVGVDLRAERIEEEREVEKVVVVCREVETGELRRFDVSDPTWYDENVWEFVKREGGEAKMRVEASARDFVLFTRDGDVTDQILDREGVTVLLFALKDDDIKNRCENRVSIAIKDAQKRGYEVLRVTTEPITDDQTGYCNMDATTMKSVLRAKVGMVVIENGVIKDKRSCTDLLKKGELREY